MNKRLIVLVLTTMSLGVACLFSVIHKNEKNSSNFDWSKYEKDKTGFPLAILLADLAEAVKDFMILRDSNNHTEIVSQAYNFHYKFIKIMNQFNKYQGNDIANSAASVAQGFSDQAEKRAFLHAQIDQENRSIDYLEKSGTLNQIENYITSARNNWPEVSVKMSQYTAKENYLSKSMQEIYHNFVSKYSQILTKDEKLEFNTLLHKRFSDDFEEFYSKIDGGEKIELIQLSIYRWPQIYLSWATILLEDQKELD